MSDALPLRLGSDVLGHCPRCAAATTTTTTDAASCPSCGAELENETVIDAPRRSGAETSQSDTALNGTSLASGPTSALPSAGSSSDPPTRFLRGIAEHVDLPVGSLVDEYEIEAKLGEGAMGIVYRARHLTLGRQVALKVIAPAMGADPQAIGRFAREARALATLRHPSVVDVYGFGELPDGRSYYSMEFLDGVTLYERLQSGRVPVDEALAILDQMAAALEAAHAAGIVHRDLKPENTFLARLEHGQSSIVKLLDFGLSKLAVADGVEKTASGAVIGTCLYISPEQARGPDVDGRTDIYALGVVGYELLLGQHPFPRVLTSTAALAAHLAETPPQPRTIWPDVPAALDLLLYSMIAKDASYRPTLAQVRSVIAGVRSGSTSEVRASRAPTLHVGRRGATRTRVWMATLVALALVLGIAIGGHLLGGTSVGDTPPSVPTTTNAGNVQIVSPTKAPVVIDAGAPVDADVVPTHADAPASNAPAPDTTTPRTRPKTKNAAIAKPPPPMDAGLAMEPTPSPDSTTPPGGDVAKPPIAPIEGPPQRPPPRKPPGRNDTINPFAKKGSATR